MNKEFDSNFFDDASKCWKKNKIKLKNGEYAYKCCGLTKKNARCIRKVYNSTSATDKYKYDIFQTWFFCKVHINTKYDENIHYISE
jgi:hypothetical protein